MEKNKTVSKEEQHDILRIKEMNQQQIQLIICLRQVCKLTQNQASAVVEVSVSSICRYEKNDQGMPLQRYTQICFYYMKHIKLNHIAISDEVLLLIEKCTAFE